MKSIDLTPLYRSTIGFDRVASLLDNAMRTEPSGYPPYNIEMFDENRYGITLAVAGFERDELTLQVENNVLRVKGQKAEQGERQYLHQGIADKAFECRFNLADYVEVTDADLDNGLLTITLVKEVPEAMKPRTIAINGSSSALEDKSASGQNKRVEATKAA